MRMKRVLLFLCAMVLVVTSVVTFAAAEKLESNSMYTRVDPSQGKTYNLKGKTVYIYDYWTRTGNDWHNAEPYSEEDYNTKKYREWIEKTYNCKVYQTQKGDWGTQAEELKKYVQNPDGNLCLFIVEPGKISQIVTGGYAADWKKSSSINLSEGKWNKNTIKMNSYAGGVYGVSVGKAEPRQCLFFNKRVLNEAGIDWNDIYDLQASNQWTWDKFVSLMKKVQRDTDNDGVNDIYGMTGSSDDFYRISVFSNGGSMFDLNSSGELVSTVGSKNSKEALTWAKKTWNTYSAPRPEEANWDWYKDFWKQGRTAFYMYQTYGGFNYNSEMSDMEDAWGCVAFPKGPKGTEYVTIVSDNVTVIPNVYSNREISEVTLIYDLWTRQAPEIEESQSEDDEDLSYLLNVTDDERAVYETYALLRESGKADLTELLGTVNEILGNQLLWSLSVNDLDELLESAKAEWNAYLKTFNKIIRRMNEEKDKNSAEISNLKYDLNKEDKTAKVVGGTKKTLTSITIPDTIKAGKITYKVTEIGDKAFEGYKKAAKLKIGKNVNLIGNYAFKGCVKLKSVSGGTGLAVIGDGAFSGCSVLTSIVLNSKVASIGDEAFLNCKKLAKIQIKTTKLTENVVGKKSFKNIPDKATIGCPKKMLKKYMKILKSRGVSKKASFKAE